MFALAENAGDFAEDRALDVARGHHAAPTGLSATAWASAC